MLAAFLSEVVPASKRWMSLDWHTWIRYPSTGHTLHGNNGALRRHSMHASIRYRRIAMIGVDARYIPVDAESVVADKDGFVLIDDDLNHMRPLEKASYQLSGKRALEPVEEAVWDTRFKPALRKQAELAVLTASG